MQKMIIPLIVLIFNSCSGKMNTDVMSHSIEEVLSINQNQENGNNSEWNYSEIKLDKVDTFLKDLCLSKDIEFVNLYPIIDSISSDNYEKIILVDSLKLRGFDIVGWGRGNWSEGPRIVSCTLSNDDCSFQVDKLYYSLEQKGKYKVTERVRLNNASR